MITARSSFNMSRFASEYKNVLRRNIGSALFYGALSFVFFTLQYILALFEYKKKFDPMLAYHNWNMVGPSMAYNGFSVTFFTMISIAVPLIIATNLFSYMHNRRSTDVYHSLPLTRDELYLASSAAGITIIWIPLIINFLIVAVASLGAPDGSAGMILLELLCWMTVTFAVFAITAFAAVQAGTVFDTAIFSIGLNGSLAAVYMVVLALASSYLYGFDSDELMMRVAYRLSPVSLMIGRQALGQSTENLELLAENNTGFIIWAAASLLIFIGGMLFYRRRRSEQAETVGTMGPLQIFLRSAGTFVGGAMLGAMFCAIFNIDDSKPAIIASMAVGSLIVYFIGDVILTRTVRSIPKAVPAAILTTIGVCVIVSAIMFGGMGYETRVPDAAQVSSITLANYTTRYGEQPSLDGSRRYYNTELTLESPEAIKLIVEAHKAQVNSYAAKGELVGGNDFYGHGLRVQYTLAGGSSLNRKYYGLYPETVAKLAEFEATPELISKSHAVFRANADMLDSVEVQNALGTAEKQLDISAAEKQELMEALRADLLAQPASEYTGGTQALGYVRLTLKYHNSNITKTQYRMGVAVAVTVGEASEEGLEDEYSVAGCDVMITNSFSNTLALLKRLDAADILQNDFSDISEAYVGIMGYQFSEMGEALFTTAPQQLDYLTDEIFNNYYEKDMGAPVYFEDIPYIKLDHAQLTAMRVHLTSTGSFAANEPYIIVAIPSGVGVNKVISGYYFAPYSALSDSQKWSLREKTLLTYSEGNLESMGYTIG